MCEDFFYVSFPTTCPPRAPAILLVLQNVLSIAVFLFLQNVTTALSFLHNVPAGPLFHQNAPVALFFLAPTTHQGVGDDLHAHLPLLRGGDLHLFHLQRLVSGPCHRRLTPERPPPKKTPQKTEPLKKAVHTEGKRAGRHWLSGREGGTGSAIAKGVNM